MNKGKLVRDRIPQIIETNEGRKPRTRTLDSAEFGRALLDKLVEEAQEVREATDGPDRLKELADLSEVWRSVLAHFGLDGSEIEAKRLERLRDRGGFAERIWWEPD